MGHHPGREPQEAQAGFCHEGDRMKGETFCSVLLLLTLIGTRVWGVRSVLYQQSRRPGRPGAARADPLDLENKDGLDWVVALELLRKPC